MLQCTGDYVHGVNVRLYLIDYKIVWLPGMDSNHDSRLQRPLSYH